MARKMRKEMFLIPMQGRARSAPEQAQQLGLSQNVTRHGLLQLFLGRAGSQVESRIEGVQFEEIAVRASGGAGPP